MRGYPARHTALWVVALSAVAASPVYHQVLPGYRYQFPRDHFNHPDFRTEWWYYTGNLRSPEGRRYGFELTFFRRGQRSLRLTIFAAATKSASTGPNMNRR